MKVLKKIETDMWINVIMMFLIGVLFIVRPQNSLVQQIINNCYIKPMPLPLH